MRDEDRDYKLFGDLDIFSHKVVTFFSGEKKVTQRKASLKILKVFGFPFFLKRYRFYPVSRLDYMLAVEHRERQGDQDREDPPRGRPPPRRAAICEASLPGTGASAVPRYLE